MKESTIVAASGGPTMAARANASDVGVTAADDRTATGYTTPEPDYSSDSDTPPQDVAASFSRQTNENHKNDDDDNLDRVNRGGNDKIHDTRLPVSNLLTHPHFRNYHHHRQFGYQPQQVPPQQQQQQQQQQPGCRLQRETADSTENQVGGGGYVSSSVGAEPSLSAATMAAGSTTGSTPTEVTSVVAFKARKATCIECYSSESHVCRTHGAAAAAAVVGSYFDADDDTSVSGNSSSTYAMTSRRTEVAPAVAPGGTTADDGSVVGCRGGGHALATAAVDATEASHGRLVRTAGGYNRLTRSGGGSSLSTTSSSSCSSDASSVIISRQDSGGYSPACRPDSGLVVGRSTAVNGTRRRRPPASHTAITGAASTASVEFQQVAAADSNSSVVRRTTEAALVATTAAPIMTATSMSSTPTNSSPGAHVSPSLINKSADSALTLEEDKYNNDENKNGGNESRYAEQFHQPLHSQQTSDTQDLYPDYVHHYQQHDVIADQQQQKQQSLQQQPISGSWRDYLTEPVADLPLDYNDLQVYGAVGYTSCYHCCCCCGCRCCCTGCGVGAERTRAERKSRAEGRRARGRSRSRHANAVTYPYQNHQQRQPTSPSPHFHHQQQPQQQQQQQQQHEYHYSPHQHHHQYPPQHLQHAARHRQRADNLQPRHRQRHDRHQHHHYVHQLRRAMSLERGTIRSRAKERADVSPVRGRRAAGARGSRHQSRRPIRRTENAHAPELAPVTSTNKSPTTRYSTRAARVTPASPAGSCRPRNQIVRTVPPTTTLPITTTNASPCLVSGHFP